MKIRLIQQDSGTFEKNVPFVQFFRTVSESIIINGVVGWVMNQSEVININHKGLEWIVIIRNPLFQS